MIDRIELIADLMAYAAQLKAAGQFIQSAVVWQCIKLIRLVQPG